MRNKIELNKEKKDEMLRLIKDYFLNERDEDLGDLAAELILDFFVENIAPEFYNQGVYDSYVFIKDKAEDLFAIQR